MGRQAIGRRWLGVLATSVIAIAACGSSSTPAPTPTAEQGPTQNPSAPMGGTLNLGIWEEPTSFLDAGILTSLSFSKLVDAPVAEGLLWCSSADETADAKSLAYHYTPWLATEVPTTTNRDVQTKGCANAAAKMCVTWKLRSGVQWHDGSTFSAHDVCDTYQF